MLAEVHVPRPSAAPWQELRKKASRLSQLHVKVFKSAVSFGFQAMGLGLEVPQHEYPLEMFLPGSDLTPLEQSIDDIINGLTKWKPTY